MSCNCNTASKTCDPCAFCTPPGVTGLTTCAPIDPCEGETIDSTCVIYSGMNFECIDVANGDTLISVLLNILETYFPPEYCCKMLGGTAVRNPVKYVFCYSIDDGTCEKACNCDETTVVVTLWSLDSPLVEGSLLYSDTSLITPAPEGWYSVGGNCYVVSGGSLIPGTSGEIQSISTCTVPTTTTSTTSTTTTTTSSTTTTTTLIQPTTCNCFRISNNTEGTYAFSYTDCSKLTVSYFDLPSGITVYRCSRSDGFIADPNLDWVDLGLCINGCPPTTTSTSTTTTTTVIECNCIYMVYTGDSTSEPILYVDCEGVTSDPFTLSTETPTFYTCGSNPETTDTDVAFYLGAACSGGECTSSFIISNSLSGSAITAVTPFSLSVYELFPTYSFPVTYAGYTANVYGIHTTYGGSFYVNINNTGGAGCLKLLVNNVVVYSTPVLGFSTGLYTLTLSSTATATDIIKIQLTPGPC